MSPNHMSLFPSFNFPLAGKFHLMIKPVGAACNLACNYCYYSHKKDLLKEAPHAIMDEDTLRLCLQQYLEANHAQQVVFSWQGGEPTLAGLDFFRRVVHLQKQLAPSRAISNTLQTNGTLLNEEWAQFLQENSFRVGLSVDGPEAIHNACRRYASGQPSMKHVLRAHQLLNDYRIPYTALATIHRDNVTKPLEVYRFLTRELGATYIQLNPCVEHISLTNTPPGLWPTKQQPRLGSKRLEPGNPLSVVMDWSLPAQAWGEFLNAVFDEWVEHDLGRVLVNWFETAVAQLSGLPAQICLCGELCGKGVALNYDGRLYSCDHYVYPTHLLGDIHTQTMQELVFSSKQKKFAFAKQKELPSDCLHCPYGNLCWGQCPRHRFVRTASGEGGLNYLCPGWKLFYRHSLPTLKQIVACLP